GRSAKVGEGEYEDTQCEHSHRLLDGCRRCRSRGCATRGAWRWWSWRRWHARRWWRYARWRRRWLLTWRRAHERDVATQRGWWLLPPIRANWWWQLLPTQRWRWLLVSIFAGRRHR